MNMDILNTDGTKYELFTNTNTIYLDRCLELLNSKSTDNIGPIVIDYSIDFSIASWTTFPENSVLFLLGDEGCKKSIKTLATQYSHIFTNYWNKPQNLSNVTPIPLGFRCNAFGDKIPFRERLYDFSFSGYINDNRLPMVSSLASIPMPILVALCSVRRTKIINIVGKYVSLSHQRCSFVPTSGFSQGLTATGYDYLLRQTKISLCPPGFINSESYRYTESMQRGCVTVTGTLPNRSFYHLSPAIQLSNFSCTRQVVEFARRYLLHNNGLSEAAYDHYKRDLSPEATSEAITDIIGTISH
jgi:hypothetical protein